MADAGLPWSIPNAGFSIQPVNGEFAAWSKGSSVPPDGWSVLSGSWPASLSRCQGGTGPWAVDFGSAGVPSTLVSDYIVVLPNTRYLLSALYRIVSGTGAALSQGVRVDWYDDARALISSTNLDLATGTSGSWTYLGVDTTSPIQAVYAKVVAGRFNVNGSADLQIDAIKLDRAVYIPSGVISLDDVTDGVTYARPRGAYMSGGIINAVIRGAGTVATDFLFKKPNIADPDTLDGVPDSVTYGKVKNTMLTAGEVTSLSRGGSTYATSTFFQKALDNLDVVLDGSSFRKVGTAYVDASNRITGVLRGTSPVAGADLFAKTIDTLDNVSNGTTYARVNATALSSGNPKTDSLVDGTYSKVLSTHITSGAITSLTRGGTLYATSTFFQKALDNLDNVLDGASFRKVGTAYVDSSNRVTGVLRGTSPVAGADLFAKTLDTLDNVSNGTTYARVNATALSSGNPKTDSLVDGTYAKVLADHLTSGAITSITRSGTRYASTSFFNTGLDNLSNIANGGGFNKTSSTYVNTSGQITAVRRLSADESVDNLFKKSSDTFASVAGTLSDGQLGSNVVNASNVKSQAIDWSKLDDGSPIMAWDEGRGSLLAGRVTYTNGGTLQTPEANQGYTSWAVTSGTTDFYVETNIQFRTIKDQFVSITYRTGGTTGWASSSTMRLINMGNVTQQATATMYGDGLWHTAIFDISAFTGTNTIRFDPQDGGAAIGAGATFWVSNVAVGNIGVGPGGGHTLVSYRGNVGVGTAIPLSRLSVTGASAAEAGDGITGIAQFTTGTGINTDEKLQIGVVNGSYSWIQAIKPGTAYRGLILQPSGGNVGIGTTSPGYKLTLAGETQQYPTSLSIAATGHATSRRAGALFGDWLLGQDSNGNGTKDFFIYDGNIPATRLYISTSGNVGINNGGPSYRLDVVGPSLGSTAGNESALFRTFASSSNGDQIITRLRRQVNGTGWDSADWQMFRIVDGTSMAGITFNRSQGVALTTGGGTERLTVDSGGNVGVGGTPNAKLHTYATNENLRMEGTDPWATFYQSGTRKGWFGYGSGAGTTTWAFTNEVAAGALMFDTNGGAYRFTDFNGGGTTGASLNNNGDLIRTTSDGTLKEDLQPLGSSLEAVCLMEPVSFMWKDRKSFGSRRDIGLVAQDVRMLVPEAVSSNPDGSLSLDYIKLVPVLAGAIKELLERIKRLEAVQS